MHENLASLALDRSLLASLDGGKRPEPLGGCHPKPYLAGPRAVRRTFARTKRQGQMFFPPYESPPSSLVNTKSCRKLHNRILPSLVDGADNTGQAQNKWRRPPDSFRPTRRTQTRSTALGGAMSVGKQGDSDLECHCCCSCCGALFESPTPALGVGR